MDGQWFLHMVPLCMVNPFFLAITLLLLHIPKHLLGTLLSMQHCSEEVPLSFAPTSRGVAKLQNKIQSGLKY